MHLLTTFIPLALALSTFTVAHPKLHLAPHHYRGHLLRRSDLTADQLTQIAPTSNTCTGAAQPDECLTADKAVPFILASFKTYKITAPATQAALIATMALESGEFKYAKNHFPAPGRPGQGTRNMQSKEFNDEYAASIPEVAKLMPEAQKHGDSGVRDLLTNFGDYDFGSAAWFLTSQCTADVQSALAKGGDQAFAGYLACIGTQGTNARTKYYQAALKALGVSTS